MLALAFLLRVWGYGFDIELEVSDHSGISAAKNTLYFYQGHCVLPVDSIEYPDRLQPCLKMYLVALTGHCYSIFRSIGNFLICLGGYDPLLKITDITLKDILIISRIISVLAGTASVYVLYVLGKAFGNRKIAWMSAIFLAVVPIHVLLSHSSDSSALLVFLICLGLLYCLRACREGRLPYFFAAGLLCSLAVGANSAAFPVYIPLSVSYWQSRRREGAKYVRIIPDKKLAIMVAGVVVGLLLSFPVMIMDFNHFIENLPGHLHYMNGFSLPGIYFYRSAFLNLMKIFGAIYMNRNWVQTTGFLLLAAAGAVRLCHLPAYKRALLWPFLFSYMTFLLIFKNMIGQQDVIVLIPFICLLSSIGLSIISERFISKKRLRPVLYFVITGTIGFPWFLTDVAIDYGLWQFDTKKLAANWIRNNIPPGSRICHEWSTPAVCPERYRVSYINFLYQLGMPKAESEGFNYLIGSSAAYEGLLSAGGIMRNPWVGEYFDSLNEQVMKTFRTQKAGRVNPIITIYDLKRKGPDWLRKSHVLQNLDFAYSESSPEIMILEDDLEYEGKSGFWVRGDVVVEKLLIAPEKLSRIGLLVFPTRPGTTLKVTVGGEKGWIRAGDLAPRFSLFEPRSGFPFIDYSYRVRAESPDGDPFLVKIITEPRRLDRYSGSTLHPEPVDSSFQSGYFDTWFKDSFKEDAGWWREKYTHIYQSEDLAHSEGWEEEDRYSTGEFSVAYRPGRDQSNCFVWGPYAHLPPQPWVASFRLRAGEGGGDETLAVIEVTADQGRRRLAVRELTRADFPGDFTFQEFQLPFDNRHLGDPLEFRVIATAAAPLWSDRITIYPDLAAWFRANYPMVRK